MAETGKKGKRTNLNWREVFLPLWVLKLVCVASVFFWQARVGKGTAWARAGTSRPPGSCGHPQEGPMEHFPATRALSTSCLVLGVGRMILERLSPGSPAVLSPFHLMEEARG